MKIVTAPHPALRKEADPVTEVTSELRSFIDELHQTLAETRNPRGVGLAAPQVDTNWALFATNIGQTESLPPTPRIFLNPIVTDHSKKLVLGRKKSEPRLEGCLSIPGLYGPVPRWEWIELRYDVLDPHEDRLVEKTERFSDFAARLALHETDHLHGILFTDYSLEHDLPVYQEDPITKKHHEIDRSILEMW